MPETVTYVNTVSASGRSYNNTGSKSADNIVGGSPSVAAAKAGTLTTRTDGVSGTLTMGSGHGITTGAKINIFWAVSGTYYYCAATVGTVSGTSVPFASGAGDALPAASTAITAAVPVYEDCVADGDTVVFVGLKCEDSVACLFTLTDATGATVILRKLVQPGQPYAWIGDAAASDSPVDGDVVERIYRSHADSAAAHVMPATLIYG